MADDRYRKDYPQHGRTEEHHQSQYPPLPEDPSRSGDAGRAGMSAVTLPSIHDPRGGGYGPPPPPQSSRGHPADPRYTSPNAVNGYPPPPGHPQQHMPPQGYLPPMQNQTDPRGSIYPPPNQRNSYYDDRQPPPYRDPHPQQQQQQPFDPYFFRAHPNDPLPPGYGQPYRAPSNPYGPDYGQGNGPQMAQAAPRQRTSIACRYCRKRKVCLIFVMNAHIQLTNLVSRSDAAVTRAPLEGSARIVPA